jgi:drug/metabolite transporter (DMT)-like permease
VVVKRSGRPGPLSGVLAILVAANGYAVAPMIVKRRLAHLDAKATMGGSLAIAPLLLASAAALTAPKSPLDAGALGPILVLGLLGTAVAGVPYNALITEVGPARASVITYANPVRSGGAWRGCAWRASGEREP